MKFSFKLAYIAALIQFGSPGSFLFPFSRAEASQSHGQTSNTVQCVKDICGPANKYSKQNGLVPVAKLEPESLNFIENELPTKLDTIIHNDLAGRLSFNEYQHLFERFLNENPRKIPVAIFNMSVIGDLLKPHIREILSMDSNGKYVLSAETIQKKTGISDKLAKDIADVYQTYLRSDEFYEASTISDMNFDTYLSHISKKSGSELNADFFNSVLFQYKIVYYVLQAHHELIVLNFDFSLFNTLSESEFSGLTDSKKAEYIDLFSSLRYGEAMTAHTFVDKASALTFPKEIALKALNIESKLNSTFRITSGFHKYESERRRLHNVCTKNAEILISTGVSPQLFSRFNEGVQKLKRASYHYVDKNFPVHLAPNVKNQIGNIRYTSPPTQGGVVARLKTELNSKVKFGGEGILLKKTVLKKASSDWDYYFALKTMQLSDTKTSISPSLLENCESWVDFSHEDAIYYKAETVQPSWQSVHFLESEGLGITGHEIGHLIKKLADDHSVTFPDLKKVEEESKLVHSSLGEDSTAYFDEDWADYYSGLMMNAIGNSKNYFCSLYSLTEAKNDFKHTSFKNEAAYDNHSSSLLRLFLLETQLKSTIPKSCQSLTK